MLPERVVRYLKTSLKGTPGVLAGLVGGYDSGSPVWDYRPDEDRFTLREMVAHLADWDPIFVTRLQRTLAEQNPVLPDIDEGELALTNNYAQLDPHESLRRFASHRASLLELVDTIDASQLGRTATRTMLGVLTIEDQLVMIVAHDGYHMQQAVDYMDRECEGRR